MLDSLAEVRELLFARRGLTCLDSEKILCYTKAKEVYRKMKRKSKAWGRFLLACALVLLFLPVKARADMGPKPSVDIQFTGIEGVTYYGTLLSKEAEGGAGFRAQGDTPWEVWTQGLEQEDRERLELFTAYQDPDGFSLFDWSFVCSEDNRLEWHYWAPETFKLLLYFPEEDLFCVSPIYEQYAYASYYTVDLSDYQSGTVTLEKSYDYTWELISLAARIVLTIAVELGMAVLFFGKEDKRAFRFLAVVNIATQLFLNVALNVIHYYGGTIYSLLWGSSIFLLYLLEIVVMIVEGILYTLLLPKFSEKPHSGSEIAGYTVLANVVSFAAGLLLAVKIPGIF